MSNFSSHQFSGSSWSSILPEMAAARAAVKLGSLVREEAICWTKSRGKLSFESDGSELVS